MRTEPNGPAGFRVEFDSPAELAAVERASLGVGGLLLPSAEPLPPDTLVALTLQRDRRRRGCGVGPGGRRASRGAGAPSRRESGGDRSRPACAAASGAEEEAVAIESENGDAAAPASLWEQLRRLTPPQRMLLAPKADRFARAILVQDSDPQVLFALLKNPRLALDEVLRVAKSSFLSFQAAELILKTNPWFANFDVRVALIRNPKLPTPFALRILPTLPDNEVRAIAKGAATSMPLKQAALKRLVGS